MDLLQNLLILGDNRGVRVDLEELGHLLYFVDHYSGVAALDRCEDLLLMSGELSADVGDRSLADGHLEGACRGGDLVICEDLLHDFVRRLFEGLQSDYLASFSLRYHVLENQL